MIPRTDAAQYDKLNAALTKEIHLDENPGMEPYAMILYALAR